MMSAAAYHSQEYYDIVYQSEKKASGENRISRVNNTEPYTDESGSITGQGDQVIFLITAFGPPAHVIAARLSVSGRPFCRRVH